VTLRVLRFLNLVASGVLAGVLVDFWAFTAPALASLSPEEVARVQQALDARHLLPAPVLYAVVNLTGLLVVVLPRRGSAGIFALSVTGLLCMAVGTALTLVVKVPINADFLSWSAGGTPSDWEAVRDPLALVHALRTGLVVAGFVFSLLAALFDRATGEPRAHQVP
jgi:uncharacterized membrane protein